MKDLKHYGIAGMRWGHRKGGGSVTVGPGIRGKLKEIGGLTKDAVKDDVSKARSFVDRIVKSKAPHPDSMQTKLIQKKPIVKLSNAELKIAVNRLQLEKQFKDLNPAQVGKGKGIAARLIGNFVAKSANAFVQEKMGPDASSYQFFADAVRQKANSKRG